MCVCEPLLRPPILGSPFYCPGFFLGCFRLLTANEVAVRLAAGDDKTIDAWLPHAGTIASFDSQTINHSLAASADVAEEAVPNAPLRAEPMRGNGSSLDAFDLEKVRVLMAKYLYRDKCTHSKHKMRFFGSECEDRC